MLKNKNSSIRVCRLAIQCFALYEVQIVRLSEDPILEPSAETLEVPVVDVEQMTLHPH